MEPSALQLLKDELARLEDWRREFKHKEDFNELIEALEEREMELHEDIDRLEWQELLS